MSRFDDYEVDAKTAKRSALVATFEKHVAIEGGESFVMTIEPDAASVLVTIADRRYGRDTVRCYRGAGEVSADWAAIRVRGTAVSACLFEHEGMGFWRIYVEEALECAEKEQSMRQSVVFKGDTWTRRALETMEKDARELRVAMDAPEPFKGGESVTYVPDFGQSQFCIVAGASLTALVQAKWSYVQQEKRVVLVRLSDGGFVVPTADHIVRA